MKDVAGNWLDKRWGRVCVACKAPARRFRLLCQRCGKKEPPLEVVVGKKPGARG